MKKKICRLLLNMLCILLVLMMGTLTFVSCAEQVKEPVLEYGNVKISLSMYEFMLSRMKGTLARNKYDVTPLSEFWGQTHPGQEITNEEYYNKSILDNCKNYLAALVIFEEEGLTLSDATLSEIEEEIGFYIEYDCGGSEEKMDALLSKYGIDTDTLRSIYQIEAKYQAVISHLYGDGGSQISDSVKEQYYRENYYRFKQILISNFYYEYEVDDDGNMIYFDSESGLPLYDSTNGVYHYDEDGNRLEDGYGVDIRFDEDGDPIYDKKNGVPAPKTDEDGNAVKHYFSDEEMAEREQAAKTLCNEVSGGKFSLFESKMDDWKVYEGAGEYYSDGYYLSDLESSGYTENMLDMLSSLKKMKVGDAKIIESENGYHVIMKYELDKGKYSDSDYAEWFANFDNSLITKLFIDRCEKFYSEIKTVEENLKKAKSIKSIGTNFDY